MHYADIITIPKVNDSALIALFHEVEALSDDNTSAQFNVLNSTLSEDDVARLGKNGKNSRRITRANIVLSNKVTVAFARNVSLEGQQNPVFNPNQRQRSAYFDEIAVGVVQSNKPVDAKEIGAVQAVVEKHLRPLLRAIEKSGQDDVRGVLTTEIAALAEMHRQMTEQALARDQSREAHFDGLRKTLEADIAEREDALRKKTEADTAKVNELHDELAVKQRELDDRDHMHVRRELRQFITTEVLHEVRPQATGILFFGVLAASIIISLLAAWFAFASFQLYAPEVPAFQGGSINYWLIGSVLARVILASFVSLGFLIFAVRWMRTRYLEQERLKTEFERYALDINRASWAIETIMEVGQREGQQIPREWIEGVCRGLFSKSDDKDQDTTSLEALGALLNITGRAEIGTDGTKFELERRELRRAAKETPN